MSKSRKAKELYTEKELDLDAQKCHKHGSHQAKSRPRCLFESRKNLPREEIHERRSETKK